MGKAKHIKKKIKENQAEKRKPEVTQEQKQLEEKIRRHMEYEQYPEVLETLAERIQLNEEVQPEFLYDGAYAYFMLGDYERATSWVDNVLTYDHGNLKARILLARICILEDRVENGLAVFDFVLKNGENSLAEEEQEEIEDIVSYYVRRDEERIRRQYPNIMKFIAARKQGAEEPAEQAGAHASAAPEHISIAAQAGDGPGTGNNAREILQALRDKVIGSREQEAGKDSSHAGPQSQEPAAASGSSARDILRALKDKVLEQKTQESKPDMASAQPPEQQPQIPAEDAEQKKQTVLQQNIPLREKVRLLNAFAGGYYYQKDLAAARNLLKAALSIDASDLTTLTNMAWVLLELGEKEKALQLATQAQLTDFGLIRILREDGCQRGEER